MSPSTSCQSYRRQERRGTCWGYQVQSRPGDKIWINLCQLMKSIKNLVVGWDCFNPLELKKLWSQKQVVGLCLLLDLGEKKNWATRLKHPIRKDYEGNQLMHRYCRRSPCRILHRSWCAPWQGGWSRWSSPLWPCSPSQECSAHTWASHEYSTTIIWRSDILPSPKSISMLKMQIQTQNVCANLILATWASFSASITAFLRSVSASFSITWTKKDVK